MIDSTPYPAQSGPTLGEAPNWGEGVAPVAAVLAELDSRILAQTAQFDSEVAGHLEYVLTNRGKRLRPTLALLSGAATRPEGPSDLHLDLAVVVEMIHMATLVHDDILDEAEQRRGLPTAAHKWGAETAVLVGDCLFSHALRICSQRFSQKISERISSAVCEVCTGEILQTRRRFDLRLGLDDYLRIIRLKTAELFRVSCELAGRLSDAPEEACAALGRYGESIGIAYQIYDDCLDLLGREEEAGKTLGTDLERGKITLPLLYLLQSLSGTEHETASETLLQGGGKEMLVKLARERGALDRTATLLQDYLNTADSALTLLSPSAAREGLGQIAASVRRASLAYR